MKTAHRRILKNNRRTIKHHAKSVITVGLIHAKWCTHCIALQPEWKQMKKGLRGANYKYLEIEDSDKHKDHKIANVNHRLKGEKLVANGYPTIFKIRGGNLQYYQGERNSQSMQQWFKGGNAQQQQQEVLSPTIFGKMFGGGCGCGGDHKSLL